MKTVFQNHAEVVHVWAQNTQDFGRSGNIFFENGIIYSYGTHFPIARHIDENTVLFTIDDYSISTSAHKDMVRRAVRHKKIFYVYDVRAETKKDHRDNYKNYYTRIAVLIEKSSRARSRKSVYLSDAQSLFNESLEYHKYFNLRCKLFDMPDIEKLKQDAKKQDEKNRKKTERAIREHQKKKALALSMAQSWESGLDKHGLQQVPINSSTCFNYLDYTLLRVKKENGTKAIVESSLDVRVIVKKDGRILPFVKILFKLSNRCKKTQTEYRIPPEKEVKIDYYKLNRIDENGTCFVGCHTINNDTVNRICKEIGL